MFVRCNGQCHLLYSLYCSTDEGEYGEEETQNEQENADNKREHNSVTAEH